MKFFSVFVAAVLMLSAISSAAFACPLHDKAGKAEDAVSETV